MTFKIPIMSIQDVASNIPYHPKIIILKVWLNDKVEEERNNWGIRGKGFKVDFDLERQWYPIFSIGNRWLASAFIEYVAKYKPWRRK